MRGKRAWTYPWPFSCDEYCYYFNAQNNGTENEEGSWHVVVYLVGETSVFFQINKRYEVRFEEISDYFFNARCVLTSFR